MNFSINLMGVFAVGIGAALGAWSRWGLGLLFNTLWPYFPLGTLIANLSGGLMMGVALGFIGLGRFENTTLRLFITTGFLGGLTTFSAFTGETLSLLQKQEYWWAMLHVSSHVFGALLMATAGYSIVHYLRG